jgi:hypothetical protein
MPTDNRLALGRVREARERAIAILQDHFAHDILDVDELERRVTAAHTSETVAELEALVADLPPVGAGTGQPAHTANALVPSAQIHAVEIMRGTMSATHRGGSWDVPRRLEVRGLMSATVLDFREARFPPGPIDIEIHAVMSSVEIIVPPGLSVATEGSAFMGVFEQVHRAPAHPDPETPLLRIRGRVIMGTVEVKLRLPGERGQLDGQLRAQSERRALRAERAQLRHDRRMLKEQRRLEKAQRRLESSRPGDS